MNDIKPGWMTTEFITTVFTNLVATALIWSVISQAQADQLTGSASTIAESIVQIAKIISGPILMAYQNGKYALVRSNLKAAVAGKK